MYTALVDIHLLSLLITGQQLTLKWHNWSKLQTRPEPYPDTSHAPVQQSVCQRTLEAES